MKFTDEAQEMWNKLSKEDQTAWTSNVSCQNCQAEINSNDFNASIYEGQLALFHMCEQCNNKEVRLIDVEEKNQQEVDEDFERWLKAKREKHPEAFK